MTLNVSGKHVEEIKTLVGTGDISLEEYRGKFLRICGRPLKLDDDKLVRAIAATDDDDDDLFVSNALLIEGE